MKKLLTLLPVLMLAGCAQPHVDPMAAYYKHQSDMMDWSFIETEGMRARLRCLNTAQNTPHYSIKGYEDVTDEADRKARRCDAEITRKVELELAKQPQAVQDDVRKQRQDAIDAANKKNRFDGVHDEYHGGGTGMSESEAIQQNTRAIEAQTSQMQTQTLINTIMGK